jgi:UDPglucose 6-dehydrogenase
MKISIMGAGYVGLVTGLCFADLGNEIVCIDVMENRVKELNQGLMPIYEKGLEDLLRKHLASGRFRVTQDIDAVADSDITFLCVGTPSRSDGSLDMTFVKQASEDVGRALRKKQKYHVVVVKSTVMPTTTEILVLQALERTSGKKVGKELGLAMNPEFLKEGVALADFMAPDRIIIGGIDQQSRSVIRSLYSSFDCPILETPLATAEMIKVASNSFLATKVSFVNEMGNICKEMGIDFRQVAEGMGHDQRIGKLFLRSGCGFGGSCFPKDVKGIVAEAERRQMDPVLLKAVLSVNRAQPLRLISLLRRHMPDLKGKNISILGLAFKPDTDDVREASSWVVVRELLRLGATVRAYDPKAMDNFRPGCPEISYCDSAKECLKGADAVLIVTEWKEFADPSLYGDLLVLDGRGITKTKNYEGICW